MMVRLLLLMSPVSISIINLAPKLNAFWKRLSPIEFAKLK